MESKMEDTMNVLAKLSLVQRTNRDLENMG